MRTERRIFANTAVLGVGEAVGQLATFAFVIVCGRAFGAETLGWYSLGMAVGAVATAFVTLGTHTTLLRELAQRPEVSARRIGGAWPYQLGVSLVVVTAVGAALAVFVDDRAGRWIVIALTVHHAAAAATSLFLIPLRARQIMWPSAATNAVQRGAVTLAAIALVAFGASVTPVFAAFPAVAVVVTFVVLGVVGQSGMTPRLEPNTVREQRALYADGLPFFGSSLLDVLYSRLPLLMLVAIAGAASGGIYTAADRLLVMVSAFRALFVAALFPAVAQLVAGDRERAVELSNRSMRLVLVLSIPVGGLLAIFHREIIALMFGSGFEEAARVLLLLAPLVMLRSVNAVWTSQAAAIGLQAAALRARALSVAVFAAAAAVSIVLFGAAGVAVALLLAEIVYAAALHAPLARADFAARTLPVIARSLAAVGAGAAAYVGFAALPLPLRAATVVAVIIAAVSATGAVHLHDLRYLKAILRQH